MTHTVYVATCYLANCTTSVEMKQPWDAVAEWGVKWGKLYVVYKDGTKEELDLDENIHEGLETKCPINMEIFQDDQHTKMLAGDPT